MPRPPDSPGLPSGGWLRKLRHEAAGSICALRDELELVPRGTSQHLAAFRSQGHVASHKEGTSVYYRVRDPRTFQLLETARQLISSHLEETHALLEELDDSSEALRR